MWVWFVGVAMGVVYVLEASLKKLAAMLNAPVPKRLCSNYYIYTSWRASVASETLTGVKMKKSGMFVYM